MSDELRRAAFQIQDQYCPNVGFEKTCKCKGSCELVVKMSKIDLNLAIRLDHSEMFRGMAHEP